LNDALLIRLTEHQDHCWQVFDRAGNGIGLPRRGPLVEAATHGAGRTATVLVPGERVLTLSTRVPTRQRERLALAVAGALEDRLADDIDALHFVPGPAARDGAVAAAVVARPVMQDWIDTLGAAGLGAARLVPDYLALPLAADAWHALCHDGRVLLRTGAGTGWTAPAALAAHAFATALDEAPARLVLHARDDDLLADQLATIAQAHGLGVERVNCSTLEAEALLARGVSPASLDLRQGAYRQQRDLWAGAQRWRLPLGLAGLMLLLVVVHAALSVWRLQSESNALTASIRATYQPLLPGIEEPAIARLELENRVARLGSGGRTAALLDELARLGAAARATAVRLDAVNLEGSRWMLEVSAEETGALQALRDRLSAELGRSVELAGAARSADGAQGRLVLEAAP
jgi:general secretion pathway protein L